MSIKTKVVVLLLISLCLTGLIVSGSGLLVLYSKNFNNTQENMNGQAAQLAGEVSELFASFTRSGEFYANDPDLKSGDAARIQEKIDTYFAATWGADHLVFLNSSGIRVATAPYEAKAIGVSIADRKFFKDTMNDQKSHISDVILNRATGVPSVVVTQPVKTEDGKMAGMVVQSVDLKTLQDFLSQIRVGTDGVVAIVARDGSVVAHSNSDMLHGGNKVAEELLHTLEENPGRLLAYVDLAGRDSLAVSLPIRNTDWQVILSLPMSEFKSTFYESLKSMLIALFIGLVVVGFIAWLFLIRLLRPMGQMVQQVARIGNGDLTVAMQSATQDEIGILARAIASSIGNFRNMIIEVQEASKLVSASSEELTANTDQLTQTANQIAEVIAEVASGTTNQMQAVDNAMDVVERMSAGLQQITANTESVSAMAGKTSDTAQEGGRSIQEVNNQMANIEMSVTNSAQMVDKLGRRSKEIGQIVETIAGLAGQTNLLALNAAIEAARAGEQGRGFAVVAEEVKKLAEQSQSAAEEIANLIRETQEDTDKAVTAMDEGVSEVKKGSEVVHIAGQAFQEIGGLVKQVSEQIADISSAIEQISDDSQHFVGSIKDIALVSKTVTSQSQTVSAATEEQAASLHGIASSVADLAKMAGDLQRIVSQFRI
ncbi:hypothetical protein P22_2923 [Propionispora sp. 2/2-37]|uniref:methyl-accepting chemotaxis protein n=1 Tax=Propionispora sp. 2/2-37 TaxID=1677858 RepID=UPI0006BB8A6F|nr:methyl-accepting chemotaxis protein [Propionispora sp. 2/2-37]CUH96812.1 hypothetical protein P22_2923 [Propionispora sp. 2/2-37]